MSYAFGDDDVATRRLALLAEVFAEPARSLLAAVGAEGVALAVDLGCGPGYGIDVLAEAYPAARLCGIDRSQGFLEHAGTRLPAVGWLSHDVIAMPLPTGPADLLHARFVLSHLPEPATVLAAWCTQLEPGGHVLVEEDEAILAVEPAVAAYERMAVQLIASHGGDLYVGKRLAEMPPPPTCRLVVSRSCRHEVPVALAAQLFSMNFSVWRHDPVVATRYAKAFLDGLADELSRLSSAGADAGVVAFVLRQLAIRRED